MNFWYKSRGAVSVFLVIILLPMMTFSALIVDAAKVRLGEGVAASAVDLALNTALTNYDTQLKDLYGLFATAQDMDELFEKLEDYYRTSIVSAGVSDEDAETYVEQIMAQLGMIAEEDDTADILNMQLMDFDVAKYDEASLANATLVEKQIVEFMKYRSPINTGMSFLSSLKSFTTLSKQTDLVAKRTEYYEVQQSVMETLKLAWDEIAAYNALEIRKNEYLTGLQNAFQESTDGGYTRTGPHYKYQFEINQKIIKDLYETQNYINYQCLVSKENADSIWRFTDSNGLRRDYTQYSDYSSTQLPNAEEISALIQNFYGKLNEMNAYKADVMRETPANCYKLQYLVQEMRGPLPQFTQKASDLYSIYQKLEHAFHVLNTYGSESEKQEIDETEVEVVNTPVTGMGTSSGRTTRTINRHRDQIRDDFDTIMTNVSSYARLFSEISDEVRASGAVNTTGVDQLAGNIGTKVSEYVTTVESGRDHLDLALGYLNSAKTKITDDLATAETNWKNAATDSDIKDTTLAKQDYAEIEELGKYLNAGDIQQLINRLNTLSGDLNTTAGQIRGYKYQGVFIGDIQGYGDAIAALEGKVASHVLKTVPLGEGELNTKATELFLWESGNVDTSWAAQQGHEPDLAVDKLRFYSYLYTHFSTSNSAAALDASRGGNTQSTTQAEDEENGRSLYRKIQDTGSESSVNTAGTSTESSDYKKKNEITGDNLPSAGKSGDGAKSADLPKKQKNSAALSSASSSLSGMFDELGKALKNFGTDLRDKLFVSDYVLSMFSYNTIEKEMSEKKKDGVIRDETPYTLTWVNINAENNYAYGYEVEYAIYGGKNESNVSKAYGSIYAIRLGFNLIYAFTDTEIRETALGIAVPISAATMGIIPVPLIQAAVIIGVSLCESSLDLVALRDGKAVPLFKNKQTWQCSASGLLNAAKAEVKEAVGEQIKTYAHEGLNYAEGEITKLLDATDEELEQMIQSETDAIEKNVGASYDAMITRHAESAIQQLTTLTNQALEEKAIAIETNTTQYVSDGLDRWLEQERNSSGSDSIAYIAKSEAVNIIKSQYIGPVVSVLEEGRNGVSETIESYSGRVMEEINKIRDSITTQVARAGGEIERYKDDIVDQIKSSASEGIDSLRSALDEQIDGIFGSGGALGSSDGTGVASLLSFRYSDYLRLFLMIGLYTNEEGVVLRTADLIQKNMDKRQSGFLMSKAAVYVDLTATVQVKPTLLALPLFANVENNPSTNTGWYTINVHDVRGY